MAKNPVALKVIAATGVGLFLAGVVVTLAHGPYAGLLIYPGIVLCVIAAVASALVRRNRL